MKVVNVEIKGIAPLLQHRFPENADDPKAKKRTGRIDYSKEVESAMFKNDEGILYEPSSHIEGMLRKAATSFRIPGRGRKTYKSLVLSSIVVEPDEIPIDPQDYVVDRRSVRVDRSRVYRYRPRFDKWKLNFKINVLDEQFDLGDLKSILEYGGGAIGISDYRPKFGRFEVTKFEILE